MRLCLSTEVTAAVVLHLSNLHRHTVDVPPLVALCRPDGLEVDNQGCLTLQNLMDTWGYSNGPAPQQERLHFQFQVKILVATCDHMFAMIIEV